MTRQFGTYGSAAGSVEEVTELLSRQLGAQFEERVSDYLGEYNLWCSGSGDEIRVLSNDQPDDEGYILEVTFGDFRTLVEIRSPDIAALRAKIETAGSLVWLER